MKKIIFTLAIISIGSSIQTFAQKYKAIIKTDVGTMTAILYNNTPKHTANFVKLSKNGTYNGVLFHRVIPNFMIQAGDPNSKTATADKMLGEGDLGYRIDAEFKDENIHKNGALAAARDNNPQKSSSSCQFYIVDGKKYTADEIKKIETKSGKPYTEAQRKIYEIEGGTPFLDHGYTVFGELIAGKEFIKKISGVERNGADRPKSDIKIQTIKIKKKFLGLYI